MVFLFTFSQTRPSHKNVWILKNTHRKSLNIFQFDINFIFSIWFSCLFSHKLDLEKECKYFKNIYMMSLIIFQFDINFL